MRTSTIGNTLVTVGAVVGVAVVAAIALDYAPSLTPEMVKLLLYKGLGAAAIGLMIVGTWVARSGRMNNRESSKPSTVAESATGEHVNRHALVESTPGFVPNDAIENEVGAMLEPRRDPSSQNG